MHIKRLGAFFVFSVLSVGIIRILALGTSAPMMAFFSWGFLGARISGLSAPLALGVLALYILGLVGLSTLLAALHKERGLVVLIVLHGLGTAVDAMIFGPLMVDETIGEFLFFLLFSTGIIVAYMIIDWHFAWANFNNGSNRKPSLGHLEKKWPG